MKKTLFVVLAGICSLAACKKDNEKSSLNKMLGKWNSDSTTNTLTANGVIVHHAAYFGQSDQTMEFRNDGKVYSEKMPLIIDNRNRDTSSYKMLDDSHLVIEHVTHKDTMQIKTLTDKSLVMYIKTISKDGINETTVALRK